MALIVVRDLKLKRDRMINTNFIFHCVEVEEGVRINYAEGSNGRDHCIVAGSLEEFAKSVKAAKLG